MLDYLIIGSGLFGSTFAYKAQTANKSCLVIDKRSHLGGNVYCEPIHFSSIDGKDIVVNMHKYGAHILHTSNKNVWDFLNSIVPFNRYTNSPVANYKGRLYNLPFNMNTFYQVFGTTTPSQAIERLNEERNEAKKIIIDKYGSADAETLNLNLEEQAQLLIGKTIYETLIKEYTEKQWGRKCSELPAFIIKRLPVRLVFDNNYFNDKFQGIPIGGYNKIIDGLLYGVDSMTNIDFKNCHRIYDSKSRYWHVNGPNLDIKCRNLVYTGPIDEYFNYCYGSLDWRTVSFKTRIEDTPNFQGNAVVNYTSHDVPYTRIIEHKHFEMFGQEVYVCPKTVISEEYSVEYRDGLEPYYPVNNDRNNSLAKKYQQLASKEENVIFGGRLAEYKYYDMAPIVEKVLNMKI